ncbi:MAG: hypothetical protein M3Q19_02270 [Pseudomonadota bacterium]|nr:hypothetical protein [Pseudomonadota bacterium]
MDIIAAHQQGLIEQLEKEVAAISGRPRDHVQRAMVLHHLFDHSRGAHQWALAEARREISIAHGIEALAKRVDRWGWLFTRREEAERALTLLAEALGEASRSRCAAAYLAYRLSATPALHSEAEQRLPPALLRALDGCHAARRSREAVSDETISSLVEESELHALAAADQGSLNAAWSAIGATWLGRAANPLLGTKALARGEARDRKMGLQKVEHLFRNDARLPASFRANPAQHFYALQHALAERRRQQWREACDRELDAFELAA